MSSKYYLKENFFIKLIEFPSLYNIKTDELYSIDEKAMKFLIKLTQQSLEGNDLIDFSDLINFCLQEDIITEKPQERLNPKIRQSPIPSLRYLELQITKRCNLKCKHCFVGKRENIDLPADKISKLLKEFEDLQGLRVLITGGEPLLHKEFDRINDFLSKYAIRKILFTNGLLLTENRLKSLNVEEIQISLDGMKEAHESLRGIGTFHKALSAIQRALDKGFQVSVATVIHKKNLTDFEKLEELVKNLGVREWNVDALTMTGNLRFNQEFFVEPVVAGKIMRQYGFAKQQHPRAEGYACGVHLLAIFASGKAGFCSFYEEEPLGDMDEGLENLWSKKRQILLTELECSRIKCPFLNECFGGCRYRAFSLSNKSDSRDFFKCYQMLPHNNFKNSL